MQTVLGYFYVFLATLCWSMIGPLGRFSLDAGITPLETAFWRAGFGFVFFAAHAFIANKWRVPGRVAATFIAFGIPGIAGLFLTYMIGVKGAGSAMTSVLQNGAAPVFVAFWGMLLFKEHLSQWRIMAIVLAVIGVSLMCVSGGGLAEGAAWWGVAAGIASGFCYSLHFCFGKKFLQSYSPITLYMYILPAGALFMLPFVDFMPNKTMENWFYLALLALVTVWGGYQAYCEGLKRLEISRVGVLITFEPFIAAFFSWLWWGEQFSLLGWIGAVAIIFGIILTTIERKPQDKKSQDKKTCCDKDEDCPAPGSDPGAGTANL